MKPANYAPVYAVALYPEWAEIAREHGYALAAHGSLARDFDLIAIPWADEPKDPEVLVGVLTTKFACKLVGGPPTLKPHGRLAYSLSIGLGECCVDLSFMPRMVSDQQRELDDAFDNLGITAAGALVAAAGEPVCPNCHGFGTGGALCDCPDVDPPTAGVRVEGGTSNG